MLYYHANSGTRRWKSRNARVGREWIDIALREKPGLESEFKGIKTDADDYMVKTLQRGVPGGADEDA